MMIDYNKQYNDYIFSFDIFDTLVMRLTAKPEIKFLGNYIQCYSKL